METVIVIAILGSFRVLWEYLHQKLHPMNLTDYVTKILGNIFSEVLFYAIFLGAIIAPGCQGPLVEDVEVIEIIKEDRILLEDITADTVGQTGSVNLNGHTYSLISPSTNMLSETGAYYFVWKITKKNYEKQTYLMECGTSPGNVPNVAWESFRNASYYNPLTGEFTIAEDVYMGIPEFDEGDEVCVLCDVDLETKEIRWCEY